MCQSHEASHGMHPSLCDSWKFQVILRNESNPQAKKKHHKVSSSPQCLNPTFWNQLPSSHYICCCCWSERHLLDYPQGLLEQHRSDSKKTKHIHTKETQDKFEPWLFSKLLTLRHELGPCQWHLWLEVTSHEKIACLQLELSCSSSSAHPTPTYAQYF